MIGKVVRGNDIGGLLRYLFGPGRANEHTNPHVVAAWDDDVVADHTPRSDPRLKRLTALLEQPLAALDSRPSPAVWHCPLRTAPGDRQLTDAEWADVAAEVLHQTGLAPRGDTAGCRWIAVRHADDHIHLAVTLARQDGRRARTSHDYAKLGAACRTVELRYGLKVTPARDRTAPKRPTRAEIEKAARQGLPETTRQLLRREVRRAALSSRSLQGFIRHLEVAQVQVRLRHSTINFGEVTGYSVALIDPTGDCPGPWFGGGKLAPQLTLPRLQHLWSANTAGASSDMRNRCTLGSPVARTLRSTAIVLHQLEDGDFHGAALAMAIDTVRKL
ncbi:Relaxase/Mobilisation nuclease domain-containing protein [Quadrisphaera granulorum]|uniref:Relaxase/mobilization nuclease-like protein n=1 Tax=Quadrisphaera granulorum TaxID=317664 RepID=A0A316A528_9ACTN|nr:relaxase/mobilization nuclease domain-containing protein [Quadrisphaera granulorum]PWJ52663.1 relaxase/mobilization nuclease-like protein [Quadrisphaera granulorum]SZE97485.1 Relaxase/Mobilisation nuclease domain-containing protein [Quadrisphaera granulorum]